MEKDLVARLTWHTYKCSQGACPQCPPEENPLPSYCIINLNLSYVRWLIMDGSSPINKNYLKKQQGAEAKNGAVES